MRKDSLHRVSIAAFNSFLFIACLPPLVVCVPARAAIRAHAIQPDISISAPLEFKMLDSIEVAHE